MSGGFAIFVDYLESVIGAIVSDQLRAWLNASFTAETADSHIIVIDHADLAHIIDSVVVGRH